jgi:predicted PolB exonuclease-like 3'-5' exonuclease
MGMLEKPAGMKGSEVDAYYRAGRIKQITDYCETDIVNTYHVWLRYELFRGKLSPIQFQLSEQRLKEFIEAHGNTKQHLNGVIAGSSL